MTVRSLHPSETDAAVALAARAFRDDPLFRHIYPDPASRERRFAIEHRAVLRHVHFPTGIVEAADVDGTLAGVAFWKPEGAAVDWWRELLIYPSLVRAVGLQRLSLVLDAYAAFDAALPDGRYHYLSLLVVEPTAQGAGVGGALLRAGLDRADRDGVGTFLETGTEANVRFYERHGFEVSGEIEIPEGPLHWAMWRPPVGAG